MHLLTEDNPDNEFRTPSNTNLSIWLLHSFCTVNRKWGNMLVALALLVGVLLVGRNALNPCAELHVHHIKITIITGIAEMREVW
jgi:hypothetical protein